jgi:hypothetical protein
MKRSKYNVYTGELQQSRHDKIQPLSIKFRDCSERQSVKNGEHNVCLHKNNIFTQALNQSRSVMDKDLFRP